MKEQMTARLTLAAALLAAMVPAIAQQFSVTITSPASGATFSEGANIPIAASATSRDGVTKVEFFQGTQKLGEDLSTPYSMTWLSVQAGNYSLTAKMTDSKGRIRTSAPVSIAVKGAAPPPPDSRATTGEWSPIAVWPDVAIHLHLLPDGTVLTYSDDDHVDFHTKHTRAAGSTRAFIVTIPIGANPSLATWWESPNTRTNLFCSGHAYLPDGRLLIMGGHDGTDYDGSSQTTVFDWRRTSSWDYTNPDMSAGRWYPSAVTLPNGEVLTMSGTNEGSADYVQLPEVWQTNSGGGWRPLTSAVAWFPLYPFLHVAPNGRVFVAGPGPSTYYLSTSGTGFWTVLGRHVFQAYRSYGTSVMYQPGKVLVVGGGDPPTATAEVIDLNAATPAWRSVASMSAARRHNNATILADGTVLVTGGTSAPGFNNAAGAVYAAELWDPATEQWQTLASMAAPRLYHSSAILLQDGRVLSAGGGRGESIGAVDEENAEIFTPPYLFKGTRPTISSAPTAAVTYGQTFVVGTVDAASIAQVTLVRLSSATHALNMNQRFNRLTFTPASNGLNVLAPPGPNVAPPGHYLLFIINSQGVPSVARTIQIL